MIFVDSNILMYVAGKDHPNKEPARQILARARTGGVEIFTSTEVLQEILYRYVALRRRDLARQVYGLFVEVCPRVLPVTIPDTDRAKEIIAKGTRVSVRGAFHAAVMLSTVCARSRPSTPASTPSTVCGACR